MLRSVEESLARLGLDRIDVLHVHDPDEDFGAAVGEAYRALADLRDEGVVGAVSIGVNHAPVAARFLREAAVPGPDCVLLAGRYNLLDQSGLDELLPLCVERGWLSWPRGSISLGCWPILGRVLRMGTGRFLLNWPRVSGR